MLIMRILDIAGPLVLPNPNYPVDFTHDLRCKAFRELQGFYVLVHLFDPQS